MNYENTNTSITEEIGKSIGLPQSEEARENREKHLKPLLKLGATALATLALMQGGAAEKVADAYHGATTAVAEVGSNVLGFLNHEAKFSMANVDYVVQPGDTLWTIAKTISGYENFDMRALIAELEVRNHGQKLIAGMIYEVPVSVS